MQKHTLQIKFLPFIFLFFSSDINIKIPFPVEKYYGITSSFCEYRTNHLHAGVDFSTMQKNGVPVIAVMDGIAKQVKITYRGYGKALYFYHKNDLISVYAHLSKFHPKIEEYLKPYYEKSIYPGLVELNPPIFFKKGEVIAFSGETGEGFPHLHFELRKGNMPLNPVYFFEEEKNSSLVIRRIVLRPESPYTLINGSPNKKSFYFPVKKEIKVMGRFSIGVEAYDFYNGNKRGIKKIELYLKDKLVSSLEFKKFSYDFYNGVRFFYDGNFSSFSPSKYVYILNPQKENPFDFFYGNEYFELENGKNDFKVLVEGLNSKREEKFIINYFKGLKEPLSLNYNLFFRRHFFLKNIKGSFYPEEIKNYNLSGTEYLVGYLKSGDSVRIPPFEIKNNEKFPVPVCLFKTIEDTSPLTPLTEKLNFEPKDFGITKKFEIKVKLSQVKEKEKAGFYRARGRVYIGGKWEGDYLKAEVFGPEDFFVLKDEIPPEILKVYKIKNEIFIKTKDIGSGIPWDGVQIEYNGNKKIIEYDPDHLLAKGEINFKGKITIFVKDIAGNFKKMDYNL